MNTLTLTSRQMNVFSAVARLLSFTKAAEILHMSQPAVTFQIKGAEERCGAKLFDRSHNRVTLTKAGVVVQKYLVTIGEMEQSMNSELDTLTAANSNKIRIGFSPSLSGHVLARIAGNLYMVDPTAEYDFIQVCNPEESTYDILFTTYVQKATRSFKEVHQGVYIKYLANTPFTGRTIVALDNDVQTLKSLVPEIQPTYGNYTICTLGLYDCIVPEYAMLDEGGGKEWEIVSGLTSCLYIVKPTGFVSERVARVIEQYTW